MLSRAILNTFRQNILPLRRQQTAKSLEIFEDENSEQHHLVRRVPIIRSAGPMSSSSASETSISTPELATSFLPCASSIYGAPSPPPTRQENSKISQPPPFLATSELLPSSPPPCYYSVASSLSEDPSIIDETVTMQDDEEPKSASTSVYETARSSMSGSSSREMSPPPAGNLMPPENTHEHSTPVGQRVCSSVVMTREATLTSAVSPTFKTDVAPEIVIPTSPVYFRTIVRRDHAGYGLTVCGTNPVTVRNIREGEYCHFIVS